MPDSKLPRTIAATGAAAGGAMCLWLILLHLRMIASSAPQEMREGAAVWITRLMLEGRNIYALDELPASTNVYGIVYHLVVLPFARVFGNGYPVHRVVSAIAIAGSCGLIYRFLIRRGTDRLVAVVGVIVFYMSSLYFVAPLARPDSLGVFLSLLSASLAFEPEVSTGRFLLSLAVAMTALLTKLYLAYPPFVFAAYLVVFGPRLRGLAFGLVSVASACAVLFALTIAYPAYLNVSVLINAQSASYYFSHVVSQTGDWLIFSLPLSVALIVLVLQRTVGRGAVAMSTKPGIFAFASVVNATVFALWLGGHPGAHMTYLFELVTPVLIVALLPSAGRSDWSRAAVSVALPAAMLLSAHYFPLTFSRFSRSEATFARVAADMTARQDVLGSTEVAGSLALSGQRVYDSGHSEYFVEAARDSSIPGLAPASALRARWDSFVNEISDGIASEQFDLVVRSRRRGLLPADAIAARYQVLKTYDLDFVWSGQQWPVDLWTGRGEQ